MNKTKREIPRTRKALYSLLVVFLLLGALELGQRISNHRKWSRRQSKPYSVGVETYLGQPCGDRRGSMIVRHYPHLLYALKPNQSGLGMRINSQGFRGRDWVKAKAPDSFRIAILGGSAAFGHSVREESKVFAPLLEGQLREKYAQLGKTIEVLNAGVWAYNTTQELILLTTKLLDYQLDTIVLFDGWNDFAGAGAVASGADQVINPLFLELDSQLGRGTNPGWNLLQCSAFFRGLERKIPDWVQSLGIAKAKPRATSDGEPALLLFQNNLQKMCRIANSYGIEVIVAPQPELFARGGEIPEREQQMREQKLEEGYGQRAVRDYPRYVAAARSVAEIEDAIFVDCSAIFDEEPESVFIDVVHVNQRGNEIVANNLFPAICSLIE